MRNCKKEWEDLEKTGLLTRRGLTLAKRREAFGCPCIHESGSLRRLPLLRTQDKLALGKLCSGEAAYFKLSGDEMVPTTAKAADTIGLSKKEARPLKTPLPVAPLNRPVPPLIV